ncbi:nuclease HARBI1 [Marchantia polymorpha subsp. ruderalis]|nr:hypothetical protein Mp_2g14120 [Marchantia polymorpha subsp. ruderalis]
MDSPTYQSGMDALTPSMKDEDVHMEAAALSPAIQRVSEFSPEVSEFSTGVGQESCFPVVDDQGSHFPVEDQQAAQLSGPKDQTSHYTTTQSAMFSAPAEVDSSSTLPSGVSEDSHFQTQNDEVTLFEAPNDLAPPFQSDFVDPHEFSSEDGQDVMFSTQDVEGSAFVARDDLGSTVAVVEGHGSQFSVISDQNPSFQVEHHQSSEYSREDEGGSWGSRLDPQLPGDEDEDHLCHFPPEHHQTCDDQGEYGQGSHIHGNGDPGCPSAALDDAKAQIQDEPGAQFAADEASELQSTEDQIPQFAAQEGVSSSQFPPPDPQTAPEGGGHCDFAPADVEGTQCPAGSGLDNEIKAEDDGPSSIGQGQGSSDHPVPANGAPPASDTSRKRKLAVFAAAGAVIAIQTMLVAMPEIWQPLEDDESAEKVAYQEGLHSWFGALNRAAWLLSTANGAGDGGWWVKPRTSVWFNTYLMSSSEDERWLAAIRMKRRTFLWICNSLEVHVRKQDTRLRPSIPVTVRVGATIYRLVNGVDYYEVADKFGVGESSVHEIMQDCVPAIVRVFGHHLRWPSGEAVAEVSRSFLDKCGLPNCQGALGSTHVEILNPSGPEAKKYINRTGHFSIVLQAVADTSLTFLDVCCGYPERTYDSRVLRNSGLYERALAGEVLAGPIQSINGGFQLRPYVIGGSNYPLLPWLMVPYATSSPLSYAQEQFIHHHDQGKVYTQRAFDILKRVFRVLGVGIRGRLELAPTIVHACCLLHNILIRRKELNVEAELENLGATSHNEDVEEGSSEPGDASSLEIRNQLSEYLVWAT